MNKAIKILTVCFCIGLAIIARADAQEAEIKGRVIKLELEPSKDPTNPNLWPCLLMEGKEVVLGGNPEILEELYNLYKKDVVLLVKCLPDQKFGSREYKFFEVSEIEKLSGQEYLSPRKATKEFKLALKKIGFIDSTGDQLDKSIIGLKTLWFDKNNNGSIDVSDKLFITSITTGKSDGKYLFYPSRVVIRKYRTKPAYYHTYIMLDPFPNNFESAILGKLIHEVKNDRYSVQVDKIYKPGDIGFRAPNVDEKTILINKSDLLNGLIGKNILLTGESYENILWFGENKENIERRDGQYIIKLDGKVSIRKTLIQGPWELTSAFLTDKNGQSYELRKLGYVDFWRKFVGKEVIIGGVLRPIDLFGNAYNPVIEITYLED